ncbi:MAG TPA: hypothetical protein VH720_04075 [Candidatus Limnocylindrales bacterium]|jgi:hypothetical protein
MIDPSRMVELEYRISHRHKDGSFAEMEEVRSHHSPADHDPERSWGVRRIFRCKTCEEYATIVPGQEGGPDR